jgi:hypothetical protein
MARFGERWIPLVMASDRNMAVCSVASTLLTEHGQLASPR